MKFPTYWKLGTQLKLAFAVVLLVPLTLATAWSILYYSHKIETEALQKIASDVKVASLIYQAKLEKLQGLAQAYSQKKSLRTFADLGLQDRLSRELTQALPGDGLYLAVVLDVERKLLAQASTAAQLLAPFPTSRLIEGALAGQIIVGIEVLAPSAINLEQAGVPLKHIASGQQLLALTATAPLYDLNEGQVKGVFVVRRILNGDRSLVAEIAQLLQVRAALFDAQGLPIAGNLNDLDAAPPLSTRLRAALFERGQAVEEAVIGDGGHLAKYQPLLDLDQHPIGAIVVQTGVESYMRTRRIAMLSALLIAAVGGLLAAMVSLAISRRIGRGLDTLTHGTERIAQGDYTHQLRVPGRDELGQLAERFNGMGQSLLQSFQRIEAQNDAARLAQAEKLQAEQHLVEVLRSSERLLEGRVIERTAELSESNSQLESTLADLRATQAQLIQAEKLASLGQLVANVAHEINTPISAVKLSGETIAHALDAAMENLPKLLSLLDEPSRALFSQLVSHAKQPKVVLSTREQRAIRREARRELEAAGIAYADHKANILVELGAHLAIENFLPLLRHPEAKFILDTVGRIGSIISGTSNITVSVNRVSKIVSTLKSFSQAEVVGEMTRASLQDGIEAVISIYQPQLRQGTALIRDFAKLPDVRCRPEDLKQVWTHLIHNALQAMDYNGTLTIGLRRAGNEAVVAIGDSGCGIADAIRDRIFDPFFTTRPTGEGSGLGLDIVKKIVDKHHGRIEVSSKVGVGSTFSVFLPIDASPP